MASTSKILIIGGTGYIGKFIVEASAKAGHPTFVLVRESTLSSASRAKVVETFKNLGVNFVIGDLCDHKSLVEAIKRVDVVISAIGLFQLDDQDKIIAAIKEAGNVKINSTDIAFAVNKLAQFMHRPTTGHWSLAKRLLRYLRGTLGHGLFLSRDSPTSLHAFSDADWAGNQDDRTSTSAYVIFLGKNAISWCSRKQRSVARSSTEAEYRAVALAAAEVLWLSSLLRELSITNAHPPTIYCDNVGATYLCSNPVFHSRMKHIAIDFHFVRDRVQKGQIRVSHVASSDQLADSLTKPLSKSRFSLLRSKIGVSDMPTILRGHIDKI